MGIVEMPTQWEPVPAEGHRCVFCGATIEPGAPAEAVWDLDQFTGWQVLAFHLACRSVAASDGSAAGPR
ncbi:MAG: hypothetical protein HY658_04540 [Actinobacteria bacterium]|nr:hypothetical protein [Actinomycetota bacterium]